ncbi:D-alanyl-D-alanine carboxypeptidase [Stappia sp. P2PMeth1]|uniref:D-alanyl-D-alanine carboxypeptidase n=1 Tax=Stappia sp. P2PMeth1 TaxID=2003586 RepID=UPI001AD8F415|nr:D-alanyl-D-alanine carboxypeptidase [Stappia sp. P2PMeth1]
MLLAAMALALTAMLSAPAFANPKYSGIVVDVKSGRTLYSYKADTARYPASLTKIMTLYVLFEELEAGRMSLQTRLKVSQYAASRPPSKLGLKPGSTITAKDAILALVTKSANDVAVVVAENVSGSVPAFAQRMTRTARQIGMKSTTFRNPSGLPDNAQKTTARDMALLGRAIQERFPKYYKYFNTRVYTYKGQRYGNHNRLLGRVKGVDGIKTGFIRASGFNLVTNVNTDGRHVVAVVMGGRTGASRNAQMEKLIAQYLPKATRGNRTAPMLVASAPAASAPASRSQAAATPKVTPKPLAFAELRNVPVPGLKPQEQVMQMAALSQAASAVPVAAPAARVAPAAAPMAAPVAAPAVPAVRAADAGADIVTGSIAPVPQKPDLKAILHRKAMEVAGTDMVPQGSAPNIAASQPAVPAPIPAVRTVRTQTIRVAALTDEAVATALPDPQPARQKAQQQQAHHQARADLPDAPANSSVTVAANNAADPAPGWQVQIAAAESEDAAVAMLKRAQGALGSKLRGYDPYTEPVDSGGSTLYRARFVGFETKTAAWNACRDLKQKRFNCYAVYQ